VSFKKPIFTILLFLLIAATFTVPTFAADKADDTDPTWNIYFRPGVRFGTESRVLYILDFLVPLYRDDKNILFGNVKYTPNDHDGWELNVGAGYRRILLDEKLLLGLNAYYDKRRTDWGTNHEQWGVGLEAMADLPLKPFDLGLTGRFNYYYPLSHTKIDGLGTAYASYVLSDSGIVLNGGRVEEPMRGFDYEAGVRIPYVSDYVETWAYAGGYHYKGRRVRDINGFAARLELIPTDFMRLNYEFHHDNYSKAEHYGEVSLEVPFSIGNLVTGKNPFEGFGDVFTGSRELSARMVEPVRRDVDVKVTVDEENGDVPGGGEEVENVVFVSETGSDATGDGTIDNPYATISYALASDPRIIAGTVKTIHVMNSSTTAVIDEVAAAGSLTLNVSDFLLWGSGANHPTHPVSNMPYSGHPTINDTLRLDAANPTVTGLGFDVSSGDYCINILAGSGDSGIRITNNTFFMSRAVSVYGIYADIGSGIGTEGNPVVIAGNSFDIESTGASAFGIYIRSTGAGNDFFAEITGNDMSNSITGNANTYGIYLRSENDGMGSAASPVIVSGNLVNVVSTNSYVYGIGLRSEYSSHLNVTKNVMNVQAYSRATGLYAYLHSDSLLLKFTGNDVTLKSSDSIVQGFYLDVDNGDFGAAGNPIVIKDNNFTLEAYDSTSNLLWMLMDVGNEDVYMQVLGNSITFTSTGTGSITAFHFDADGGSPGNIGFYPSYPVIISGNSLKFYGGNNLFINADTNNDNNYNYLLWGGNYLYNTGTWSGNYGPNNEVWNTFTGTDVIRP
jgi:hypothetical protein